MTDHSQLAAVTALLVKTLEERGFDCQALLLRAGIEPARLSETDARLPSESVDRLWQAIMEVSNGDLSIAIDYVQRHNWSTLHVFSFGLHASANLIEVSERIARAMRFLSDITRVVCSRAGIEFHLTCEPAGSSWAAPREVVCLAIVLNIWRSVLRADLAPLCVQFLAVDRPANAAMRARIEDYFGCPVLYRQKHIRMTLPLDVAQEPLPMANTVLAARSDAVVTEYLAEFERPAFAAAVVRCIAEGSFDKDSVARQLGISPSTLQRRLMAEKLNFKQLLLETRRNVAEGYLRSGRYSVKEVAYMLGYADPASFSHAFRDWYGVPPDTIRQR